MRHWALLPRSLFGRLVLILMAGLVLAHALSFMLVVYQRAASARSVMSYFVGQDIASAVAILERVPAAERTVWLERLQREYYRYVLGAAPQGAPLLEGPAVNVMNAARRSLGPSYVLHATSHVPGRYAIHTRLADGTPFTAEARPPPMLLPMELPLIVLAQLLVLAGFTWLAVRLVTRPLGELASAADALRPDAAPAALREDGPREVARAATAFNAMQRRIASHLAERMQILAAVSHDLQTPITRMRLRSDMLEDPVQRDKMLGDLNEMQTLVEDGIVYARSAHGLGEAPCRTDIDALLSSVVYDYLDAGAALALQGRLGRMANAHPRALRRVLTNLVDNALKFGTEVAIALQAEGDERFSIAVLDRGPGMAPEDLTKAFEPFYRVENSRSRDTGGSGLGLAIVQQLVAAMGGTVSLSNRADGGLEVRLVLRT